MRDQFGRFVKGEPVPWTWPKGKGGGGKRVPNNLEVRALARGHARLALATLAEICAGETYEARDRSYAAVALLERGYGKPHQTLEVEERGPLADYGPEDTRALWLFLKQHREAEQRHDRIEPPVVDLCAAPAAAAAPTRREGDL